jgi:hypothetical protein
MYSPNPTAISDKAQELLEEYFNDDDYLIEALIYALPVVRAMLKASPDGQSDAILDLKLELAKEAKVRRDFHAEAEDLLIAEQGYVKRVDVDQFEFVYHDTRG